MNIVVSGPCLVLCWSASFSKFCRFLNKLHDPWYIQENGMLSPFIRNGAPAVLYGAINARSRKEKLLLSPFAHGHAGLS